MTVVCATDGSPRSLSAVPHASRLAGALGTRLVLLRVLDPRVDAKGEVGPSLDQAVVKVRAAWEEELRSALQGVGIEADIDIPSRVHGEEVRDTILNAGDRLGAVAISLDTQGGGALRHAFLGSTALDMLKHTDLPLLLTGPKSGDASSGAYRVFFASDGSPASAAALAGITPIVAAAGSEMVLWRAAVTKNQGEKRAADIAAARAELEAVAASLPAGIPATLEVEDAIDQGAVAMMIVESAQQAGASAIGISTHGHSARYHLLAGSVAMAVLQASPLPLLVVRARG
jgi:nucleotide-binding universal stress UspA family protein